MNGCSKKVYGAGGWHTYACSRKATVVRDGKAYCFQHDPVKVAERETVLAERRAEREAEETVRRVERAVRLLREQGFTVLPPEKP